VTCRIATVHDAVALAHLRWEWRAGEDNAEAYAAFVERFRVFCAESFASGRWTAWVAELDGKIVATIWVQHITKVPRPDRVQLDFGYMSNVYASPEARGSGVGTELLQAVIAWAHDVGLEEIIVWPADGRAPWYERAGFTQSTEVFELDIIGYDA